MRTLAWTIFIILSLIGGFNGKEQSKKYIPRKALVIQSNLNLEDQKSFYERNKGRDFVGIFYLIFNAWLCVAQI